MIPNKRSGRPSRKPSESELSAMYAIYSANQLAEHYGVAESTIRRWIASYRHEERKKLNND